VIGGTAATLDAGHCLRRAATDRPRRADRGDQARDRRCRRRPARHLPQVGIAPNRVVAALVAEASQLLKHPNQRRPLARRLPLIRQQQPVEPIPPRIDPRQRLPPVALPQMPEGRLKAAIYRPKGSSSTTSTEPEPVAFATVIDGKFDIIESEAAVTSNNPSSNTLGDDENVP